MTKAPDLLREVRALELVARGNVSSMLAGNYRTTIIGRGRDFHESRRYLPGDDVRTIDWKTTARLDKPHVKTFLEERQREIVIALDVSPSMFTGWQRLTKIEAAVEIAATLALSAVENGDRVGWVHFADRALKTVRPRQGRRQLFLALRSWIDVLEEGPRPCPFSDIRAAIDAIQTMKGRRLVIFLISDFIDRDVPDDLRYIARRHDVSLLHVYDPLEFGGDLDLPFFARGPEGPSSPTVLRLDRLPSLESVEGGLKLQATRHGISMQSFSTRAPVGPALNRFFHRRKTEGSV